MLLNAVSTYSPTVTGTSSVQRAGGSAQKEAKGSALPYVSPVLRIDIGQGGPVMAYRDRQTGEVTEQRSARLDSVRENEAVERESGGISNNAPAGESEASPPSADRVEAANSAYQNSASHSEPARPTSLSFEA